MHRTYTIPIIFNNCLKISNLWVHYIQRAKKNKNFLLFYAVTCPPLILENGEVAYNTSLLIDEVFPTHPTSGYSVNTMASLSCDKFYHRQESSSVICENSGNWNELTPICNACYKNEN